MTQQTDAAPVSGGGETDDELEPLYGTVEQWVEAIFTPTFPRQSRARWCARWFEHPEAIVVLSALWMTWEMARLEDGRAIADWLTRYLYPLHHELCSDDGPMSACTAERHVDVEPWQIDPAPAGYWSE